MSTGERERQREAILMSTGERNHVDEYMGEKEANVDENRREREREGVRCVHKREKPC